HGRSPTGNSSLPAGSDMHIGRSTGFARCVEQSGNSKSDREVELVAPAHLRNCLVRLRLSLPTLFALHERNGSGRVRHSRRAEVLPEEVDLPLLARDVELRIG